MTFLPKAARQQVRLVSTHTGSVVERAIRKLRESGHLQRISPSKGGYWQVIDSNEQETLM